MCRSALVVLVLAVFPSLAGCRLFRDSGSISHEEILRVLAKQQGDWNSGDIDAFFEAYANDGSLRFVSGDSVVHGWQETRDRFKKKYSDRARMGQLEFDILELESLAGDLVLVVGSWRLELEDSSPGGKFSLLFRRSEAGWRIFHDHTSLATP